MKTNSESWVSIASLPSRQLQDKQKIMVISNDIKVE